MINKDILFNFINEVFVSKYPEIVCKVEFFKPQYLDPYKIEDKFHIMIYFIGGYGTKYFPITQAIREKYEELSYELQDYILNFWDEFIPIHYKNINNCDEITKVSIKESNQNPSLNSKLVLFQKLIDSAVKQTKKICEEGDYEDYVTEGTCDEVSILERIILNDISFDEKRNLFTLKVKIEFNFIKPYYEFEEIQYEISHLLKDLIGKNEIVIVDIENTRKNFDW